jgi:hypothetical protein
LVALFEIFDALQPDLPTFELGAESLLITHHRVERWITGRVSPFPLGGESNAFIGEQIILQIFAENFNASGSRELR